MKFRRLLFDGEWERISVVSDKVHDYWIWAFYWTKNTQKRGYFV